MTKFNPMTGEFEEEQTFSPLDLLSLPTDAGVVDNTSQLETPTVETQDPLANLEDKGYIPPTQKQMDSPGFKAAQNVFSGKMNSSPIVGRGPAEELQSKLDELKMLQIPTPQENEVAAQTEPIVKKQSLLDEYKNLLEQQRTQNRNLDLLAAANKIGQGIASGYGAKIDDGSDLVNQLRKSAAQPVEGYLGRSKALSVENEVQLNDPNSDISKLAREQAKAYAKRLGMDETRVSQLDGLSAKQLESLGFKNSVSSMTPQLRFERIKGEDGVVKTVAVDTRTGQVVRELGEAGFANQFRTDPNTGEIIALNSSNPAMTPIMPTKGMQKQTAAAPAATATEKPAEEQVVTRKDLNPKEKELVDNTRKTLTDNKQYKDSQEAIDGAENALQLLSLGKDGGPDLVRAIQTMLAKSSGQVGVLTDQDVAGFNGRADVLSTLERSLKSATEGRLPDADRAFLEKYAKTMSSAAKRNLDQVNYQVAKQLSDDTGLSLKQSAGLLNTEARINPKQLSQELATDKVKVKLPDGKIGTIPRSNLQKALEKGAVEVK